MQPITLDFETHGIATRPAYPPRPVGLAIGYPGRAVKYLAWGHPTNNNCTEARAKQELTDIYRSGKPLLFQNAKFDVEVAEAAWGLRVPSWERLHDTMYLLFLTDPHAKTLSLKPSAERYLNLPPEEQDKVKQWVLANVQCKPSEWGANIAAAPGDLVGAYAIGDVDRTRRLFNLLHPKIVEQGMGAAYDRERHLMPILLRNEQAGIRLDVAALERDVAEWEKAVRKAEQWLHKTLRREFNLDSDEEKAEALQQAGVVTAWKLTKTGKRSTAKGAMTPDMFADGKVYQALAYRDRLCTCLRMFALPWLAQARADGYVRTTWNQVRQPDGNALSGTRTGRPSTSNPNFLNVSKTWDDKDDGYTHPTWLRVPPLPLMRRYLLPDVGHTWLHRDYNQQELRMLAHFENALLMEAYQKNPRMDVHAFVADTVSKMRGEPFGRRPAKITVFGKIYGRGLPAMCAALKCTTEEAKTVVRSIEQALPGLKALEQSIKQSGRSGEPICTWGGRLYLAEPPAYSKKYGRNMTFEYKLISYLIQGSSADATKEALIRYSDTAKESRLLVSVYDEINISAPIKAAKREMERLRQAMESIEVDVPLLSDGKIGPSWGEITKYEND